MGSREQSSREADAPQAQQERNGGGGSGGGSRGGGGGGGGACEVSSHEGAAQEPMNADGLASARSTGSNNWRSPPLNRPAAIARPQLGRSASKLLSEMGLRGVGDLVAEAVARSSEGSAAASPAMSRSAGGGGGKKHEPASVSVTLGGAAGAGGSRPSSRGSVSGAGEEAVRRPAPAPPTPPPTASRQGSRGAEPFEQRGALAGRGRSAQGGPLVERKEAPHSVQAPLGAQARAQRRRHSALGTLDAGTHLGHRVETRLGSVRESEPFSAQGRALRRRHSAAVGAAASDRRSRLGSVRENEPLNAQGRALKGKNQEHGALSRQGDEGGVRARGASARD